MTKTEQVLMSRRRNDGSIWIDGKREYDAAKRLVAKGLAVQFDSHSSMSSGVFKVNPFTRTGYVTKSVFVYGGNLHFGVAK